MYSRLSSLALATGLVALGAVPAIQAQAKVSKQHPNILFIVMDDVGIDQMKIFGYGGAEAPKTPNIDALALGGVRFRNAWTMPSCSPSRATFFDGRYPFRTNVLNAVTSMDLANSQVSPYEETAPKILKKSGYASALFGKMHLSGSDLGPANNPLGDNVMRVLGWDYFEGYLDGAPYPIDPTAGGVSAKFPDLADKNIYPCGFVPNETDNPAYGANQGACYTADNGCAELSTADSPTPGKLCLERGGIFDPKAACQSPRPAYLDFSVQNGYYTGLWVINKEDGSTETIPASGGRARGYRTTLETDRAIAWIKRQPVDKPWMVSLGYSAIHAPLQPPPAALLPAGSADTDGYNCTDAGQQRVMGTLMLEAMDKEIGRLLVETGLAKRSTGGGIEYRPEATDTAIVVVGDNGTYTFSVKAPFNPVRAKGTPYQTGVWVPLIVAGPMVKQPGREVPHMISSADLFALFGELAGVDVRKAVPKSHALDSAPMLSYLTQPGRSSIRSFNYTQMGDNLRANGSSAPPCLIEAANLCVQVFPQQAVCEDQGGTWYGPGGAAEPEKYPDGLPSCCALNQYLTGNGQAEADILPVDQKAIRNDGFKLVRMERVNCSTGGTDITDELYEINEKAPVPKLDNGIDNLLDNHKLTLRQRLNYQALLKKLGLLEQSSVSCPGDGNLDLVVDGKDLQGWQQFSTLNQGRSSWYDFNLDGLTDEPDKAIIQQNLGKNCKPWNVLQTGTGY
ncbi:sulfatase-like hydrolase/transferase [Methylococcus sp. Mc7]|uniref:sulfatase-like hydrolase/transferase n=1 Tax=Methylococcus sp. Mc7 TaxID=2860258 RepID=UPI001C527883|nr:sulfatase-like hydrolase/transferase [Methylococcus sp. Mc7]QXP84993.1 sulfatase-like hydrolase/transferase [Methylococcus sp. Mc7]